MAEWISTAERLPKLRQTVFIRYMLKNGKEEIAETWFDGVYVFNFKNSMRFVRLKDVTYWKPTEE